MPEFKTTAKGADAPFVKRTAAPVEILGTAYDVHFAKGEGDKGWRAFASASLESANAFGKTLDVAVLALKSHMEDVAEADSMGSDAPQSAPVAEETAPVDAPQGADVREESVTEETAPVDDSPVQGGDVTEETAPVKMSAGEVAAHAAKAVKDAREAYGEYVRGERDVTSANGAAMAACTMVTAVVQNLPEGEQRSRLYRYGTALAEHYYCKTGGGYTTLTDAQRSRAGRKFRKIVAELAKFPKLSEELAK